MDACYLYWSSTKIQEAKANTQRFRQQTIQASTDSKINYLLWLLFSLEILFLQLIDLGLQKVYL